MLGERMSSDWKHYYVYPRRILFAFDFQGDLKRAAADIESTFMQELGKHGLPILVHCVSCGYEAIQMLEKCDYDAVILKPTVRLSQTEEIDSLDFLRMIAHIAECAEESLCQTLVVLNDEQMGLADTYKNSLTAEIADKIHIMKSRSIVDVVRNLGAVLSLTNR